ncbi:MAG: RDD family [Rhodobacteraceae bacterium HLUCCA12]|nr:MAG: RDD family [Rhodobacteraceae bacterium HLUCCA12]
MSLPDPAHAPDLYRDLILKRFIAWCVDLVVTLVLVAAIVLLTAFVGLFFLPILWIAVSVTYRAVMLANHSATLGMMLAAIRLRHLNGHRPDPMTCLWHAVIFLASMASVVGQIASVGLMLITPYRQGLNDVVLGTTMINRYLEDR